VTGSGVWVEELAEAPPGFLEDDLEGEALYRAFAEAGVENFEVGYLRVWRDGAPVATAPYFRTPYAINTTLPRGFSSEPGLPVAVLEIKGDFYSGLKQHVRSDFRRRMRKAAALRIEEHDGYPAFVGARLYALYLEVLEHSEFSLERLTPAFFEKLGPISKYVLYWEGAELIGFSLLLCGRGRMHYKYLGMDYARGRPHGLYFIMCLSHIELCLRDGITTYQTGATSYPFKQRLGSTLEPVKLYFKHRNPVLNWLVQGYMALASFGER